MRGDHLGGVGDGEGLEDLGDEAVPVVPPPPRGAEFGRIVLATTSDDEDLGRALEESASRFDDIVWSRFVMMRFTWQRYLDWWAARRWIRPRDVRRG